MGDSLPPDTGGWEGGWHRSHHVLLCIRIGNDGLLSEGPPGFPWVSRGTSVLPPFVPREGRLKKAKKKREGT